MKAVFALVLCVFATGCAHGHRSHSHTHTPVVPDAVKARCAVKAEYPRKCINRWKAEHSYTHSHHRGHHHGHSHVKSNVKVGVIVPIK